VQAPPFSVGDVVQASFPVASNASDICAPSSTPASAWGVVGVVDGSGNVGVRWVRVRNNSPRPGLTAAQCCWTRTAPALGGPSTQWDLTYWGDENHNPTYVGGMSGLYSQFSAAAAKTALTKIASIPPSC
jgi:hypothetical protein